MHSSASMLKQMFVQPTPPLHTAVARAKSQYVTPFIAMYYVVPTFIKKKFFNIVTFKILYFLKLCPIFVGSVHNFGKSDNDKI